MAWIVIVFGMLAAQSSDQDAALKRIRAALQAPAAPLTLSAKSIEETQAVFRVHIEQPRPLEFAPPWEPEKIAPSYVRTTRPLHHHEFLLAVTPEEFRSSVLYPGPDMLPLLEAPARAAAAGISAVRERQVRDSVTKQVQRLLFATGK
jgi:hypothetical protein